VDEKPEQRENRLIRDALIHLAVPGDHAAQKRRFLQSVAKQSVEKQPWYVLSKPRTAFALALAYSLAVCLYFISQITLNPTIQVKVPEDEGWAAGILQALRRNSGGVCHYQMGSDLLLQEGTEIYVLKPARLAVSITTEQRQIHLMQGSIHIKAAHDPEHPLVVKVGENQARVLGTEFVVTAGKAWSESEWRQD
jgi:hypothetical protein